MNPTPDILRTARTQLFTHASLWMPAFMTILLQDLVLPVATTGGSQGQALAGLMAAIGAVMIGAGWVAMIGAALRGERPGLQAFADGVNARWLPVLAGTLVYWLVIVAIAGFCFAWGDQAYGWDKLRGWLEAFLALPPEAQQAALDPTKIAAPVRGWMNVIATGCLAFVLANALLIFWEPLVVLKGRGWLAAWAESIGLVLRRPGQVLAIGALQLASMFLARSMMVSTSPLASLLGVSLYVGAVALFTIAWAAVVEDALPREGQHVDVQA